MSNYDLYLMDKLYLEQNHAQHINAEEFSDRVTRRVEETNLDDNSARHEVLEEMRNGK